MLVRHHRRGVRNSCCPMMLAMRPPSILFFFFPSHPTQVRRMTRILTRGMILTQGCGGPAQNQGLGLSVRHSTPVRQITVPCWGRGGWLVARVQTQVSVRDCLIVGPAVGANESAPGRCRIMASSVSRYCRPSVSLANIINSTGAGLAGFPRQTSRSVLRSREASMKSALFGLQPTSPPPNLAPTPYVVCTRSYGSGPASLLLLTSQTALRGPKAHILWLPGSPIPRKS